MGAVYLARDLQLDRPVALKVLPPEFAAQPDLRERFLRETRTAASFSHPNIVPVFSVEDHDGVLAFAMGFVEGESVAERVTRAGPLEVREVVRLLQDVAYALAYAHGRGVVHRDIKPDNIMLERATGRALVMDFGISRTIASSAVPSTPGLTRVGEVVGTPEFMSPEQASGDAVDGRSDLYSLGLVAWFAVTGRLAISGDSTQKVLVKQLTEAVPSVAGERADLPPALADTIDRCLQKDPAERFATAEELVETLDAAKLGGPEVPLPIRLFAEEAGKSGLILVGGALVGWVMLRVLRDLFQGNLDVIMPFVVYVAVVWGRLIQTLRMATRLAVRGFRVGEVQQGFVAIQAEREAERAQLRADPVVVRRRRRQIVLALLLLTSTGIAQWYVWQFHRLEIRPGWFGVDRPGTVTLIAISVTRGFCLISLLGSPLRRPLGEWVFRLFWMGAPGRAVLRLAGRGVERPGASVLRSTGGTAPAARAPSAPLAPAGPGPDRLAAIEARLGDLESWRRSL
jgi:serine/threonine-protein kinase